MNVWQDVGIGVERKGYAGMAEAVGDYFWIDAVHKQERRTRMAKRIWRYRFLDFGFVENRFEVSAN